MLYGPYSSEYPGNSMGGVMRIITRSPRETEFTFDQANAAQSFSLYDTDNHFSTSQTSATAGGCEGDFTWFAAGNFQNSFSQPLTFITASAIPGGTSGAISANNKLGQTADVLGAGGLLHTREANVLARVGYDLTPAWRLTYLADFWRNDADAGVSTYLTDATGQPTFGRTAGFASNDYQLLENHLMNGLSLKSDTHGSWDGEAVATYYDFLQDRQVSPANVGSGTTFTPSGRLADYGGTQWGTVDLKGTWRPCGYGGPDALSFGGHVDRYTLNNPTYNTTDWPTLPTYPVPVTYVLNVGEVRNRGVELAGQKADLGWSGFDLEGSVTFVDSITLADSNFASTTGTTAVGKHAPYRFPRGRWLGSCI
jgi:iron complex outermembrane receptor protein